MTAPDDRPRGPATTWNFEVPDSWFRRFLVMLGAGGGAGLVIAHPDVTGWASGVACLVWSWVVSLTLLTRARGRQIRAENRRNAPAVDAWLIEAGFDSLDLPATPPRNGRRG